MSIKLTNLITKYINMGYGSDDAEILAYQELDEEDVDQE